MNIFIVLLRFEPGVLEGMAFPSRGRDIYKDTIQIYMATRRIAKCNEVLRETEMAGFNLDCPNLTDGAAASFIYKVFSKFCRTIILIDAGICK